MITCNEPAFIPVQENMEFLSVGLTIRQLFAAICIHPLLQDASYNSASAIAREAVKQADALIAELNK